MNTHHDPAAFQMLGPVGPPVMNTNDSNPAKYRLRYQESFQAL